jgi:hypothetical protein
VTKEGPNGQRCLKNYQRYTTDYRATTSDGVGVGDFVVPPKNANTLMSYDLAHNPSLFNHTRVGRLEMTKSAANLAGTSKALETSGGWKKPTGTTYIQGLNASGARSSLQSFADKLPPKVEANKKQMSTRSASQSLKPPTATHWSTEYKGTILESANLPPNHSQAPLWSYPRQAYSSKRSFHMSEYMISMGTYGHNPRNKLNATST